MTLREKFSRAFAWGSTQPNKPAPHMEASQLERIVEGGSVVAHVYRIDNGFVVCNYSVARPEVKVRYCADHTALADYFIADSVREKLTVHPVQPHAAQTASLWTNGPAHSTQIGGTVKIL